MNKEFVPYEQAVALKELGFDEPCFGRYYYKESYPMLNPQSEETELVFEFGQYIRQTEVTLLAPLYQQVFRWFREKYNLHSEIILDQTTQPKYCFEIHKYEDFGNYEEIRIGEWFLYRTYEEAEFSCLEKLIEIVK